MAYRKRRSEIVQLALAYKVGEPIPRLQYTKEEVATWAFCYGRLTEMFKTTACREFNDIIDEFQTHVGYSASEIP